MAGFINPFDPTPEFINAVKGQESSGGKNKAVGKAGERGPLQIRPETAAAYGYSLADLQNPEIAEKAGTRYLGDMLKRYKGNKFLALVAYNSGPGRVDKGQLLPQSVKYATRILQSMKIPQAQPQPDAQPTGTETQTPGTPLPSWSSGASAAPSAMPSFTSQQGLTEGRQTEEVPSHGLFGRIGSAVGSALEGTAEAGELPPPPPGAAGPVQAIGGGQPAAAPPPPPGAAGPPQQWKPSFGMGAGGQLRFGMTAVPPPQLPVNVRTQEATAKIVLGQVDDAIGFYDKNIKPHESRYSGSILSPSGRHAFVQPYEATQSRWTQALGLPPADPAVKTFYDKAGPIMAEQLRTLIGGRVGQYMVEGPLAPHLPNIEKDSLPRMREKLEDLKANVPIILQNIQNMRAQGMNDDQIVAAYGGSGGAPTAVPSAGAEGSEPPPPEGYQ